MYSSDKEAIILEYIYYNDSLKHRELADKAGISLGMVNAILKRLIEKGWLMTKRLNSRNISYVVSPDGIEEIFKRSYCYFKRTIDDIKFYRDKIEQLVEGAVNAGYKEVVLIGKSDLDFLVEYACGKAGAPLKRVEADIGRFAVFSEQNEINSKNAEKQWLRTIILKEKNTR
jgi:DNA-binding MarR family transcriptional regulator